MVALVHQATGLLLILSRPGGRCGPPVGDGTVPLDGGRYGPPFSPVTVRVELRGAVLDPNPDQARRRPERTHAERQHLDDFQLDEAVDQAPGELLGPPVVL